MYSHSSDSPESDWVDSPFDLSVDSTSSLVPAAVYKNHEPPPRHKAHLIPIEIFTEIFLYTAQADPSSQVNLMLVCRHWYKIMLSTPGIHSQLKISYGTEKEDVERFGRRWHLDVTIEMENREFQWPFDPKRFFASFMAAAQAASRWRSLNLVAFPPPGKYKDLQIVLPLQHLETFKLLHLATLATFWSRL